MDGTTPIEIILLISFDYAAAPITICEPTVTLTLSTGGRSEESEGTTIEESFWPADVSFCPAANSDRGREQSHRIGCLVILRETDVIRNLLSRERRIPTPHHDSPAATLAIP